MSAQENTLKEDFMPNLDQNIEPKSYDYPITSIEIRQGHTNPIFTIRVKDSDEGDFIPVEASKFVGSVAVIKPTGYEDAVAGQLEMVQGDSETVFVHIPTDFTNGLNPLINRPIKVGFDIWESDDGTTPVGSGVVGGTILVRERITRNTRVGSQNVSTM